MSNLSKHKVVLAKAFTTVTSVATMLSMSGVMYLAPVANAVAPADYGLKEGDVVSAAGSDDPDVYIVNEMGYKRLFLNPAIFNFYGHLGGFAAVKNVSPATRDAFGTSGLFRNCETNDEKVYGVETTGEDTGMLHWVNTSGSQAVADDANFFKKVFCINSNEFSWYSKGSDYTSVNQVPSYVRGTTTPTPAPTGPLSVMLSPENPVGRTVTSNAVGLEMLKFRVSGSGTVSTVTVKRLGAGGTGDFGNLYIYEGASRLVSGKSFSTASGEVTFLLNVAVSGWKDLSVVADMSTGDAGNVNYFQLKDVTASGGAVVSGFPLNGNNFTVATATSGGVTVNRSGSLSNPTVGQKGAMISEFKLTANTEAASVKRLTMINDGNIKASDVTNVKLKSGANEWSGVSTSNGYLVFDLGAGHAIAKGGNAIYQVFADLSGKKDETVNLYFEYSTDILVIGDQYGWGMAITNTELDDTSDRTDLTLQGGALTLVFNGPGAKTVGTQATDVTFLKYSMTAVSNIEVKKTEVTICGSNDALTDTTFEDVSAQADIDNLLDIKIWNEDTNTVIVGPADGTGFDVDDAGSCPDSVSGAQKNFTDVFDLMAGKTYNFKITADIDATVDTATFPVANDIVRLVLDDYSDDAAITVMKYSGTNTAVGAADIVPRADISSNNVTLSSAALTLSLAGAPSSQTKIRGTKMVDGVGITFAAGQASDMKITTIKLTGYASDETTGATFDEGVDPSSNDSGTSVANAMSKVELYESGGALVADSSKVTSNQLGSATTGTMTFSNLSWMIPAGTSKTLLVRSDLSNNTASGTDGDRYAFDIAATGDVTALDSSSNTVNAGNAGVNGTTAPTKILTVKNSGSMTLATSADSPAKGAIYWGQTSTPISKFRISATDEGQYIEKLTIIASDSDENTDAANNVKDVILSYKNKAGSIVTKVQSFGNLASVNFAWSTTDADRPYVPQDGSLDISVNANMKTKTEGATADSNSAVFFSLDLSDAFLGSYVNGFRAVGDGSGTVTDGTGTNINDVLGAKNQYVYRVFPKIEQVALSAPYNLLGTPTVFKFSVTAMGAPGSNLRFDNEHRGSGSLYFEVVSSGQVVTTNASTTYSVLDENGAVVDGPSAIEQSGDLGTAHLSQSNPAFEAAPAVNGSISFDFTAQDIEIGAGLTRTFSIRINNPSTNYAKTTATGRAADYFQVTMEDIAGVINWVGNYGGDTNALDTAATAGVLRSVPLYGPTFQR